MLNKRRASPRKEKKPSEIESIRALFEEQAELDLMRVERVIIREITSPSPQ